MPTYEYVCSECGHAFEEFQSMKADLLRTCPNCGKDTLKRIMGGGGGMIFKGQGFYLTDYKKSGGSSTSEGKPKSNAKKPDKTKADSKPDSSRKDDSSTKPPPAPSDKKK